jgi:hypothetical protein
MQSLRFYVLVSALVLSLFLPAVNNAAIVQLTADIDGNQVLNLPVGLGPSPGIGSATMTLDNITNLFDWNISWSGLLGQETVMHFHGPATPSQNAGVQVNFGAISGTTSPSIGSTTITSGQAADLLSGLWYINIHTNLYPGGEIRGQVEVVPIPASGLLFLSALTGFGLIHWRKKR